MMGPLRVAVIGAECTGKTTLCRALAAAHGGDWVAEALREFVDRTGRPPTAAEQPALLDEQLQRERAALARARPAALPLLAFDSAPLVTALYSRMYYDDDTLLAAATAHQRGYALTLVADVDLPWEPDGLMRDGPAVRARFHALLVDWLQARALPFLLVSGAGTARLAGATAAISAKLAAR